MERMREDVLSTYKTLAGEGFKTPTLASVKKVLKRTNPKVTDDGVRKIFNAERLIYRHRGKTYNPCQVKISDSIKKRKK